MQSFLMTRRFGCTLMLTFALAAAGSVRAAIADDSVAIGHGGKAVAAEVERLLDELTLEEKVSLCHANSKFTIAGVPRLGIAEMCMSDGPHGVREEIARDSWKSAGWTNDHATYLPTLTAVAATFDPEMARLHGSVLGAEARERGKDVILGPGCNLARNPLYGRNFEYFGEDPFLAATLIVPEIRAIQANDVAACAKHYALNTQELNRHGVNAQPDERTLREIYLPAFEAAVKEGGVWTIMGAYNEFRGTNCNQSKHLVMDILKGEWGYRGLLVTDWDCDINTRDAAVKGLDIEMGTRKPSYNEYYLADPFLKLLHDGSIPESVLDDKVRRILRVQLSIGMMDKDRNPGARGTQEHHDHARKIIENGVVLLKNEGDRLPLAKKKLRNVLVMGPNASKRHGHGGGSSQVKSLFEITPLEGLRKELGDRVNITHLKAMPPESDGLLPIAADFIITKHSGAGTPAWKTLTYETEAKKKQTSFAWSPKSRVRFEDDQLHHQRMITELMPIESGDHTFQIEADGRFDLQVNGKSVLSDESTNLGQTLICEVNLEKEKPCSVVFSYDGTQGYTIGWTAPGDPRVGEDIYVKAASEADAVVYFAGLNHSFDREAEDRVDMKLPGNQDYVIEKLLDANPDTVVCVIAGSAVEMPWVEKANALLWGWYGGMFAGQAYADVMLGDVVPSGKMPITLPKRLEDNPHVHLNDYDAETCFYKEGVMMGYRWFENKNIEPMFPFGHGLSYTTFDYSDIDVKVPQAGKNDSLTVSVSVTNTGEVAGAEVVQLYVEDVQSSVDRPKKELKGFRKILLQPGETRIVSIPVPRRELSFWDVNDHDWKLESGEFRFHVGSSSSDIKLQASCDVLGD